MENCTTIPELCNIYNLSPNTIRWILNSKSIKKKTLFKKELNGFMGHLYLKHDCENVIDKYLERKNILPEKPKEPAKKYPLNFVCQVLRKNIKSNLCNKVLSVWTNDDWIEFNKMIPEQLKAS